MKILFDGLYVITNVPAQIVAFLTGVTGARIFPLLPPAPRVPAGRGGDPAGRRLWSAAAHPDRPRSCPAAQEARRDSHCR